MMKLIAAVFALVAFTAVSAQDFRASAGLEIALPMGDFADAYSLGYGLSVGGELPVGDNLGITGTVGYILLSPTSDVSDFIKNAAMIPAQVGAKYYFSEQQLGAYAQAQVGIHAVSQTTEDIEVGGITIEGDSDSESNLSWAIGAGYFINENIDIGVRFNSITTDVEEADPSSYIGLRAAFNF